MTLKKLLEGRPFGHPLHTLIVHLPLGLWLFALILDIVSFAGGGNWALQGAAWALLFGTAAAVFAAITGLNDWLDIRADHPAQTAALWHMAMMVPSTLLFAIDTLLHFTNRAEPHVTALMLALSAVGYGLAIVGGYLGGLLIYDNGVSVGRHRRTTELPQNTIHEPRKGTTESPLAPSTGLSSEYHPVIPDAALPEGHTLRVEIQGTVFMLVRAQGQVYAVQDFCTHRCAPLSEGAVCGQEIRCPWHNSQFDLATGKVTRGPAKVDLKTYEVRVRGGIIHACIDRCAPPPDGQAAAAPPAAEPRPATPPERRNPEETPGYSREGQRDASNRRTPAD
jgi:nitrite reductase/ring-hydroxylating ferredoxin subunit/uncharacterized membrane protein